MAAALRELFEAGFITEEEWQRRTAQESDALPVRTGTGADVFDVSNVLNPGANFTTAVDFTAPSPGLASTYHPTIMTSVPSFDDDRMSLDPPELYSSSSLAPLRAQLAGSDGLSASGAGAAPEILYPARPQAPRRAETSSTSHTRGGARDRQMRLFLSSTFKDMRLEREVLVKQVLPEVRRLALQRGVQFTAIDFRWGITKEESQNHETLHRCLAEVDKCRPFFFGMIGERYGWSHHSCTSEKESDQLAATLDRAALSFPWVKNYGDRSITELEMLYGALFWPEQAKGASTFFLRDPSFAASRPSAERRELEADSAAELTAVADLRSRIAASGLPAASYDSIESFAAQAREALISMLEHSFPEAEMNREFLVKDSESRRFSRSFLETFVPRGDVFDVIDGFVSQRTSTEPSYSNSASGGSILLSGAPGTGRTSTLCAWFEHFLVDEHAPPAALHVCGLLDGGASVVGVLHSLMQQIKSICDISLEIPEDTSALQASFIDFIQLAADAQVSGSSSRSGLVIAIDGLERLDESAQTLHWLPNQIPPGVVFVLSSENGCAADKRLKSLRKVETAQEHRLAGRRGGGIQNVEPKPSARRADRVVTLTTLDSHEKRRIVSKYLARYSKKLGFAQKTLIVESRATDNPAFLAAVLGALRSFGDFDRLDSFLRQTLLSARSLSELYSRLLVQWETDFGEALVKNCCGLLTASRHGLLEEELLQCLQLLGGSDSSVALQWSGFVDAAGDVLTGTGGNGGGVITFGQSAFERAAIARYRLELDTRGFSKAIAVVFSRRGNTTPLSPNASITAVLTERRRVSECLTHLEKIADQEPKFRESFSALLQSYRTFDLLSVDPADRLDLMRWGKKVAEGGIPDMSPYLDEAKQVTSVLDSKTAAQRLLNLSQFCVDMGDTTTATDVLRTVEVQLGRSPEGTELHQIRSELNYRRAEIAIALGEFATALEYAVRAFEAQAMVLGAKNVESKTTGRNAFERVEALVRAALPYVPKASSVNQLSFSRSLSLVALLAKKLSDYDAAASLYASAVQLEQVARGAKHPIVAQTQLLLADVRRKQAQYSEAETLYKRALSVLRLAYGEGSPLVSDCLEGQGRCAKKRGAYEDAIPLYVSALKILETLYGEKHPRIAELCLDLGDAYRKVARWNDCQTMYFRALEISKLVRGEAHPDTAEILNQIGMLHKLRGQSEEALTYIKRALGIAEQSLGRDHVKVANCCTNLADVLSINGSYKEATVVYERALRIYESALGADHPEVSEVLNALGMIEKKVGRYKEAEKRFSRSLEIIETAYDDKHPKVALYAHNLGVVARKLKQFDRAWDLYSRALELNSEKFGSRHPLVAGNLNGLGMLRKETGKDLDEAMEFHRRALQIFEESFGPNHEKVALTLNLLAEVYRKQGKNDYDESEAIYDRALRVNRANLPEDHPEIAENLNGLAQVYKAQQNYTKAEPMFKEAIRMSEVTLGPAHPHVINRWRNLARLYEALGRVEESESVWATVKERQELRQKELDSWT